LELEKLQFKGWANRGKTHPFAPGFNAFFKRLSGLSITNLSQNERWKTCKAIRERLFRQQPIDTQSQGEAYLHTNKPLQIPYFTRENAYFGGIK